MTRMRSGTDRAPTVPTASRTAILTLMCLFQFVLVVSVTIVVVSLPAIRSDLGFHPADLQWVVTAYGLTFGGMLLLGGRLADAYGRRRLFLLGATAFALGSALCAVAPSSIALIAARALQGLGAAIAAPASLSLLIGAYDTADERRIALGIWAAVGASGATLGNILGGFLTQVGGWRLVFLVNLPICLGVILLTRKWIAVSPGTDARRPDLLGATLVTGGIGLLMFAVGSVQSNGPLAPVTLISGVVAIALLLGFAGTQRWLADPLVPRRTLDRRSYIGFGMVVLVTSSNIGAYYFSSILMQEHLGYSPLLTGFAFAPWAGLIAVVSQVVSRRMGGSGARFVLPIALFCATAGTFLLWLRLSASMEFPTDILPPFLLLGVGTGAAGVASTIIAMQAVPDRAQGMAAGLLNGAQQVGGSITIAILATVAGGQAAAAAARGSDPVASELAGLRFGMLGGVFAGAIALFAALWFAMSRRRGEDAPDELIPAAAVAPGDPQVVVREHPESVGSVPHRCGVEGPSPA